MTETEKKIKINANAYVLTQHDKMSRLTKIVGVYPTRAAAELEKTQQDMYGGVINHIETTVLYGAENLETEYSNMPQYHPQMFLKDGEQE
jgi:hypothetical protein